MGNFYQGVANTVASNRTNASYAQATGSFLDAFMESWKQGKLDDLANHLLAERNAQKATAVTDADGNPIIDPDATTDPAAEAAVNRSLGYGYDTTPTVPDKGGLSGLKLSLLMDQDRTRQVIAAARVKKALTPPAAKPVDPLDDALKRARLARLTAGAGAPGMTPGQQAVQSRFDQREADRQTERAERQAERATPKPVYDSYDKIDEDFKAATGHKFSELNDETPDRQHLDGDKFWVGGYTDPVTHLFKPNESSKPKPEWGAPADLYQQALERRKKVLGGNPAVLNQPAIDAAKTYGTRVTPAGPSAATDPAVSATPPLPEASDATPPASTRGTASGSAAAIRAKYRAGQITKEQAKAQLVALGIN